MHCLSDVRLRLIPERAYRVRSSRRSTPSNTPLRPVLTTEARGGTVPSTSTDPFADCTPESARALLAALPDPVVVLDLRARVLFATPAAGRLLGQDPTSLVGRPFGITVTTDETAEVGLLRGEGDELVLEMRVATFTWDGQPAQLVSLRDVTRRSGIEEEMRQAIARDARRDICDRIARDYRNLHTTILCGAQLAEESAQDGDEIVGIARNIATAAREASALTRRLLTVVGARVRSNVTADLNDTVSSFERQMRPLLEQGVELDVRPNSSRTPVGMDPEHIASILAELVQNACDALPRGGRLTLTTSTRTIEARPDAPLARPAPGSYGVLSVVDSGSGMTRETRDRLFDAYYTTKDDRRGRGLGLAEVYGLVEQAGGFLEVESEVGEGTRIDVLLPLATDAPTDAAQPPQSPYAALVDKTVLLAEDEEGIRRLLAEVLHQVGASVIHAPDAGKASSLLAQLGDDVDLLITDVRMPGGSGLDIIRECRTAGNEVPAILISGYSAKLPDGSTPEGIVEFLPKPFLPGALLQLACHLLETSAAGGARTGA